MRRPTSAPARPERLPSAGWCGMKASFVLVATAAHPRQGHRRRAGHRRAGADDVSVIAGTTSSVAAQAAGLKTARRRGGWFCRLIGLAAPRTLDPDATFIFDR